MTVAKGLLVTASCTTGWTDWIHGELWLLPSGLLRIEVGLARTVRHANRRTVTETPPVKEFTDASIGELLKAGKKNLWIPWTDVRNWRFRRGLASDSLHVQMITGRKYHLMWLKVDRAYKPLKQALERHVPPKH